MGPVEELGEVGPSGLRPMVARLKGRYGERISGELVQPAIAARYADLPAGLHPGLTKALAARGVERLYSHQRAVWDLVRSGHHVVVATPTASGKTLCYNLPVLDAVLDGGAKALYLFPTKALAQDQVAELLELNRAGGPGRPCLHLRRRHPGGCPQGGAYPRRHRRLQPGHAPPGDPAPPHQVGAVLRGPAIRGGGRAARLPRGLRLPCGQCPAAPAAGLPLLRGRPALHLRLRHHRQPRRSWRAC